MKSISEKLNQKNKNLLKKIKTMVRKTLTTQILLFIFHPSLLHHFPSVSKPMQSRPRPPHPLPNSLSAPLPPPALWLPRPRRGPDGLE
jgi:hypothetical protein